MRNYRVTFKQGYNDTESFVLSECACWEFIRQALATYEKNKYGENLKISVELMKSEDEEF